MKKRCRVSYGLKKNENKGDVELTLSGARLSPEHCAFKSFYHGIFIVDCSSD